MCNRNFGFGWDSVFKVSKPVIVRNQIDLWTIFYNGCLRDQQTTVKCCFLGQHFFSFSSSFVSQNQMAIYLFTNILCIKTVWHHSGGNPLMWRFRSHDMWCYSGHLSGDRVPSSFLWGQWWFTVRKPLSDACSSGRTLWGSVEFHMLDEKKDRGQ